MSTAIVQRSFGGPEVLGLEHVDTPATSDLLPGEVLVRVAYAGVNPVDTKTRKGAAVAGLFAGFPLTIGWDLSGTVIATGPAVTSLKTGDRVFGMSRFPHPGNAYAELVIADASDVVVIPAGVSDEQAAALPLAGLTAWEFLVEVGAVKPGQLVLIQGAGGGTGHLAVQIARHLGAHVTATASTSKQSWLRELGADRAIDYTVDDMPTSFADRPFDLVFNASNGTARAGILTTKAGGIVIDISETVTDADRELALATGVRVEVPAVSLNRTGLEALADLAAAGHLVAHVDRIYPLADAAEAHRQLEAGHAQGKLLLRP